MACRSRRPARASTRSWWRSPPPRRRAAAGRRRGPRRGCAHRAASRARRLFAGLGRSHHGVPGDRSRARFPGDPGSRAGDDAGAGAALRSGRQRASGARARRDGIGQGALRARAPRARGSRLAALRRAQLRRRTRRALRGRTLRSCARIIHRRRARPPRPRRQGRERDAFLDEIGELPLLRQAALLRALESRRYRPVGSDEEIPFDVRIVAATNRDLEAGVAERTFRQDLLYRINAVSIRVPPLRERVEDHAGGRAEGRRRRRAAGVREIGYPGKLRHDRRGAGPIARGYARLEALVLCAEEGREAGRPEGRPAEAISSRCPRPAGS